MSSGPPPPKRREITSPSRGEGLRLIAGGLAPALSNSKSMLFYIVLAPVLIDMTKP